MFGRARKSFAAYGTSYKRFQTCWNGTRCRGNICRGLVVLMDTSLVLRFGENDDEVYGKHSEKPADQSGVRSRTPPSVHQLWQSTVDYTPEKKRRCPRCSRKAIARNVISRNAGLDIPSARICPPTHTRYHCSNGCLTLSSDRKSSSGSGGNTESFDCGTVSPAKERARVGQR